MLLPDTANLIYISGIGSVHPVWTWLLIWKAELRVVTHPELKQLQRESPGGPLSQAGDSQQPRNRTSRAL